MGNSKLNHRPLMTFIVVLMLLSACSSSSSSSTSETSTNPSLTSQNSTTSEVSSSSIDSSSTSTESEAVTSESSTSIVATSLPPSSSEITTSDIVTSESDSVQTYIWPTEVITTMFDGYTIQAYEGVSGDQLTYLTDEVNRMVVITITTNTQTAFTDYIATLDQHYYHTYVNYLNSFAVSTSGGNIFVYFNFTDNILSLTILGLDYTYYDSYFATFIRANNTNFPTNLLSYVYGEALSQIILSYSTSGYFCYYTRILMGKYNVVITVKQSSEFEFSDYYFALSDAHWFMQGLIMANEYSANDNTEQVKLEVSYDGVADTTISISLLSNVTTKNEKKEG